jgi:hypothetical protein
VLHIELVIMYKLFMHCVYIEFIINFFEHAVVGW